jgi:hypothetical protein
MRDRHRRRDQDRDQGPGRGGDDERTLRRLLHGCPQAAPASTKKATVQRHAVHADE